MPDFTFQLSHCYVSPDNHQRLQQNLPHVGESKLVNIDGDLVWRQVCRFSDDRIYIKGPHESAKLAWLKVSQQNGMPSLPLPTFAPPPPRSPRPTPVGIPTFAAQDSAALAHFQALAQSSLGHSETLGGPQVPAQSSAGSSMRRSRTVRPSTVVTTPQHQTPTAFAPDASRNAPANAAQHNVRPVPRATPVGYVPPSGPSWYSLDPLVLRSILPMPALQEVIAAWPDRAFADIVSPDQQMRRICRQGGVVTATDVLGNVTPLAWLQ